MLEKKSLIFLGDSILNTYPYGVDYSWYKGFYEQYHSSYHIVSLAYNGANIGDMYYILENYLSHHSPDLVKSIFVLSGLNEVFSSLSLASMENTLKQLYHLVIKNHINLIYGLSIAPIELEDNLYRRWQKIRNIFIQNITYNSILYIDFNILGRSDFFDNIHPNKEGYKKLWENFLLKWENIQRSF